MAERIFLQVDGLRFSYPECAVLNGLSLAWPAGLALVRGDESSGKTTLLRLLAGELTAQAGRITLQGTSPDEAPKAYAQKVFWADPRSGDLDTLTARGWLDSLPARYPLWDVAALDAHTEGFALHEHLHGLHDAGVELAARLAALWRKVRVLTTPALHHIRIRHGADDEGAALAHGDAMQVRLGAQRGLLDWCVSYRGIGGVAGETIGKTLLTIGGVGGQGQ